MYSNEFSLSADYSTLGSLTTSSFRKITTVKADIGEYSFLINPYLIKDYRKNLPSMSGAYNLLDKSNILTCKKGLPFFMPVKIIYWGEKTHLNVKLVEINNEPVKGNFYYQGKVWGTQTSSQGYLVLKNLNNVVAELSPNIVELKDDVVWHLKMITPFFELTEFMGGTKEENPKYYGKS